MSVGWSLWRAGWLGGHEHVYGEMSPFSGTIAYGPVTSTSNQTWNISVPPLLPRCLVLPCKTLKILLRSVFARVRFLLPQVGCSQFRLGRPCSCSIWPKSAKTEASQEGGSEARSDLADITNPVTRTVIWGRIPDDLKLRSTSQRP